MSNSNRTVAGILIGLSLTLCLCVGVAFFIVSLVSEKALSSSESSLGAGKDAPDFILPSLNGQDIRLEELSGKAILLNFWASWCYPCEEEMPLLEAASQEYEELLIVGINVGDRRAKVENSVAAEHLTFMILLDEDEKVSQDYIITGFPTSIFIDKDGVIQSLILGELSSEELKANLALIGIQ